MKKKIFSLHVQFRLSRFELIITLEQVEKNTSTDFSISKTFSITFQGDRFLDVPNRFSDTLIIIKPIIEV